MSVTAVLLIAGMVGADHGWETAADGRVEYVLTVDRDTLKQICDGGLELVTELHPEAPRPDRIRLQLRASSDSKPNQTPDGSSITPIVQRPGAATGSLSGDAPFSTSQPPLTDLTSPPGQSSLPAAPLPPGDTSGSGTPFSSRPLPSMGSLPTDVSPNVPGRTVGDDPRDPTSRRDRTGRPAAPWPRTEYPSDDPNANPASTGGNQSPWPRTGNYSNADGQNVQPQSGTGDYADLWRRQNPNYATNPATGDYVDPRDPARTGTDPRLPDSIPLRPGTSDPRTGYQDPRYSDPRATDPRVTDPRYTDPRYADPRVADPRTLPGNGQVPVREPYPTAGTYDPRVDPRASYDPRTGYDARIDPRVDPRAGYDPRTYDPRTGYDPRVAVDNRGPIQNPDLPLNPPGQYTTQGRKAAGPIEDYRGDLSVTPVAGDTNANAFRSRPLIDEDLDSEDSDDRARDRDRSEETEPPWVPLTLAVLGLFGSLAANIYQGWIAAGLYGRYRDLADDVREMHSTAA